MLLESHTLRNVELLQGRQAGCRLTPCRLSRCYNVTLGLAEMPARPKARLRRRELVPKTPQARLAAGVVCARDPVCAVVRTFPRARRPGRAGGSDRADRY